MLDAVWEQHKQVVLSKEDKSFKKSIDAPIVFAVNAINSSDNFFTTSSCSGRIMVINEEGDKRKHGAQFVFVSHNFVETNEAGTLLEKVTAIRGNVFLKLEPLILHIECKTLDLALKLLHSFKAESRFKHTSIVSAVNSKYIVCIKAMPKLEIPIKYVGEVIVTVELLTKYLSIANQRMAENFDAISSLNELISGGILHDPLKLVSSASLELDTRKFPYLEVADTHTDEYESLSVIHIEDKKLSFFDVCISLDGRVIYENKEGVRVTPDRGGSWPIILNDTGNYVYDISSRMRIFVFNQSEEDPPNIWLLIQRDTRKSKISKYVWKRVLGEIRFPVENIEISRKSTEAEIFLKLSSTDHHIIRWRNTN